jgi:hypothetical protein
MGRMVPARFPAKSGVINAIGVICTGRKGAGLSHNLLKEVGFDSNPL